MKHKLVDPKGALFLVDKSQNKNKTKKKVVSFLLEWREDFEINRKIIKISK